MAWQEGQRNRWRGSEEKEVINGSQSLAFDQVVWSEVRLKGPGDEVRWWEEERKQRACEGSGERQGVGEGRS